jgi:hypothetical protein
MWYTICCFSPIAGDKNFEQEVNLDPKGYAESYAARFMDIAYPDVEVRVLDAKWHNVDGHAVLHFLGLTIGEGALITGFVTAP